MKKILIKTLLTVIMLFFIKPAVATICILNGANFNINGSLVDVPVDMNKYSNMPGDFTYVDLSTQLKCKFNDQVGLPSNYVDTLYLDGISNINSKFTGAGLTTWYEVNGTRYTNLAASGLNIKVTDLPNNSVYYFINVKVGMVIPDLYSGNISLTSGEHIINLLFNQKTNYNSDQNKSTLNIKSNSDATINIRSCNVDVSNQNVKLGPVTTNDVVSAGKVTAGSTNFNVTLSCIAGTIVSVTPAGTPATPPSDGVYANQSTGADAATNTGIALECQPKGGAMQPMKNGTKIQVASAAGTAESLPCVASYYSNGNGTAGAVSSAVTFNFTYN